MVVDTLNPNKYHLYSTPKKRKQEAIHKEPQSPKPLYTQAKWQLTDHINDPQMKDFTFIAGNDSIILWGKRKKHSPGISNPNGYRNKLVFMCIQFATARSFILSPASLLELLWPRAHRQGGVCWVRLSFLRHTNDNPLVKMPWFWTDRVHLILCPPALQLKHNRCAIHREITSAKRKSVLWNHMVWQEKHN